MQEYNEERITFDAFHLVPPDCLLPYKPEVVLRFVGRLADISAKRHSDRSEVGTERCLNVGEAEVSSTEYEAEGACKLGNGRGRPSVFLAPANQRSRAGLRRLICVSRCVPLGVVLSFVRNQRKYRKKL